eukprot:TRINITY_DN1300_c0_g1_i2.p1 TRINITY_DN1300_c0_g1~~TRINITY_DN1300_c0_g1_i2.p1  ORF type:complete len:599 (-),score=134.76 TRINITY_DN1300_c0_g1_i2:43-1839(-)
MASESACISEIPHITADLQSLVLEHIELLQSVNTLVPCKRDNSIGAFLHATITSPDRMRWVRNFMYGCCNCNTLLEPIFEWNTSADSISCPRCGTFTKIEHPFEQQPMKVQRQEHAPRPIDDKNFLLYSIKRYIRFLYVQKSNPFVNLYIPADIRFVMHVHLLHPSAYGGMCQRMFGNLIDFEMRRKMSSLEQSAAIWNAFNGEFTEEGVIGMDLIPSATSQCCFINKFSEESLRCDGFLLRGEANYLRFFQLMNVKDNESMLVPTVHIDLFWHTHMRSPIAYVRDCNANLGRLLDHDDSVSDEVLGEHLEYTKSLWATAFEESYIPKPSEVVTQVQAKKSASSPVQVTFLVFIMFVILFIFVMYSQHPDPVILNFLRYSMFGSLLAMIVARIVAARRLTAAQQIADQQAREESAGCGSGCGAKNAASCGSGCGAKNAKTPASCGSGCGAKKAASCGSGCGANKVANATSPASCGSGCGANRVANANSPASCGSGCGANKVNVAASCGSGCGANRVANANTSASCGSGCSANKVNMNTAMTPASCGSGCGAKSAANQPASCGSGCGANKVADANSPASCGSGCGAKKVEKASLLNNQF